MAELGQQTKGRYYRALKAAGVPLEKHYREFSAEELIELAGENGVSPEPVEQSAPAAPQAARVAVPPPVAAAPAVPAPMPRDPNEMPGQRLNTKAEDEPIRVDENGLIWYQEEVLKPAAPRPRGRRVLKYLETGVEVETVQNGEYVEEFEVAGKGVGRPAEIKITLPSYQVGIYKDPRFPFKIHTYNGTQGFDLFEVEEYFGGSEMVPEDVKRMYVQNDLCYDIRTVIRAIQTEYRQMQLTGRA